MFVIRCALIVVVVVVVVLVVCWFASLCLLLFGRRCFWCGVVGVDGCMLFVVG